MTKKELIEKLKEFDDNDEIHVEFSLGDRPFMCDLESLIFVKVLTGNINNFVKRFR